MKPLTAITILVGTILVAGCSMGTTNGISLSENKLIDNNCSGGGGFVNERWCTDELHPSAGPYGDM